MQVQTLLDGRCRNAPIRIRTLVLMSRALIGRVKKPTWSRRDRSKAHRPRRRCLRRLKGMERQKPPHVPALARLRADPGRAEGASQWLGSRTLGEGARWRCAPRSDWCSRCRLKKVAWRPDRRVNLSGREARALTPAADSSRLRRPASPRRCRVIFKAGVEHLRWLAGLTWIKTAYP